MENNITPEQPPKKKFRKTPRAKRLFASPQPGPSTYQPGPAAYSSIDGSESSGSELSDWGFPLRTPTTPTLSSVEKVSGNDSHFVLSSPLTPTPVSPHINLVSSPEMDSVNANDVLNQRYDSDTTIVISSDDDSEIELPQTPEEIELLEHWQFNLTIQKQKLERQIDKIENILDQVRQ